MPRSTFLCAMRPDMREDWAAGWARHLAPGGRLITLIFPDNPKADPGPPWYIYPDLVKTLLTPHGAPCACVCGGGCWWGAWEGRRGRGEKGPAFSAAAWGNSVGNPWPADGATCAVPSPGGTSSPVDEGMTNFWYLPLYRAGFELLSLEKVPEEQSHEGRKGEEWMAVWEKR